MIFDNGKHKKENVWISPSYIKNIIIFKVYNFISIIVDPKDYLAGTYTKCSLIQEKINICLFVFDCLDYNLKSLKQLF